MVTALADYKKWMQSDLLKRSAGQVRDGCGHLPQEARGRRDDRVPLDRLLAIAEQDLKKNQAAFAGTAKAIDPKRSPAEVLASVQADHPEPSKLLSVTQGELDSIF